MNYKTVAIFKLHAGMAEEEIRRCKSEDSLLNTLKKFPGFIAYEVIKINEDSTMTIQTWESKAHFTEAIPKGVASRAQVVNNRENIVLSYEGFYGEVVHSSF